ncbi:MAG TPA: MFS transporter, partial [Bacteroidales bacterium]|nr:MFS transporter [Bacteroidales bacterium]
GLKSGLSIGGALVSLILGQYGYIHAEAGETILQPQTVAHGVKMMVSIYAALPFLICCALLFFYEINKTTEIQIESDLKKRRNN